MKARDDTKRMYYNSKTGRHVFMATVFLGLCCCKNEARSILFYKHSTTDTPENTSKKEVTFSAYIPTSTSETVPQTTASACNDIVCKTEAGTHQINASLCQGWSTVFVVQPSKPASQIGIWMSPKEARESFLCIWRIQATKGHLTLVYYAFPFLSHLSFDVHNVKATKTRPGERIGDTELSGKPLKLYWFEQTFVFSYLGKPPYCFSFKKILDLEIQTFSVLHSGQLSQTAFFVTSPGFDGVKSYPGNYIGDFVISVPRDHSVLVKSTHFELEDLKECILCPVTYICNDKLIIVELHEGNFTKGRTWSGCGSRIIPLQIFRRSVVVYFQTNKQRNFIGFKLMYVVIPTRDEPVQNAGKLDNCSSSFFFRARDLFRCNLILECEDSEDEEECYMYDPVCGVGGVKLGHKCINIYIPGKEITWHEAQFQCFEKTKNLITFSLPEYQNSLKWMKIKFGVFHFFLGLEMRKKSFVTPLSVLYQNIWQWTDSRSAFVSIKPDTNRNDIAIPMCAYVNSGTIHADPCDKMRNVYLICEFDRPIMNLSVPDIFPNMPVGKLNTTFHNKEVVFCPLGYITRDFLSCNETSHCGKNTLQVCQKNTEVFMYPCDDGATFVPYSLVCDHISDCRDNSDEDFCHYRPCPRNLFQCQSGQCIEHEHVCDETLHCFDKSDEETCNFPNHYFKDYVRIPAIFTLNGKGTYITNHSHMCPSTHFRCPDGYCFPVYLRCNRIDDCPGREDEAACDSHTCVGYYRCRESTVCLHTDHVCDGVFQCPQYDDELLCQKIICSDVCQCQGLAFICNSTFLVSSYPDLRYLDVSGTAMRSESLTHIWYLTTLSLSNTELSEVPKLALPNLRQLDLSYNEITFCNMQVFQFLKNLRVLIFKSNPVLQVFNMPLSGMDFIKLQNMSFSLKNFRPLDKLLLNNIDLSHTHLRFYNGSAFANVPQLKTLNISWSKMLSTTELGFACTRKLEVIDVRGSPLKIFPNNLLKSLASLQFVYATNFKLCCEAMLPHDFNMNNCHADQDALASCTDLLRSNAFRVFIWVFMFLSLVGNAGSFAARLFLTNKEASMSSFSIFVMHLCIADFFMGIYLTIISAADLFYLGEYLWNDDQWKTSSACSLAGFLSFMSNEVSVFIICLITLDRFIVLRFPFSSFRFKTQSSLITCAIIWAVGISLASFPLFPVVSHWKYYSQTSICIPLPFATDEKFKGRFYSMGVMIVINFVLFLLIALGQVLIYWSVQKNSMSSFKHQGSKDIVIARRLTSVVMSDFLCWFPVGLLGLLSTTGTSIPREINVGVVIFVLPVNSAMNPFLYTFNVLLEKREKQQEDRLLKRLQASSHAANNQNTTNT